MTQPTIYTIYCAAYLPSGRWDQPGTPSAPGWSPRLRWKPWRSG